MDKCAGIRKLTSPKRALSCNEARAPRRGRFLSEAASPFFSSSAMAERCFLDADSKEIGQILARMCSSNCLTGPPISTYSAPPPLTPARQNPHLSVTYEEEERHFFPVLIGRDDGMIVILVCILHVPVISDCGLLMPRFTSSD